MPSRRLSLIFRGRTYRLLGGYFVHVPDDGSPRRYLHRDLWEAANGRLASGEVLHHLNNQKPGHWLKAMKPMTAAQHKRLHRRGRRG